MSLKNTPTDTALGFEESPFAGSFELIRRKTEHRAYSAIIKNARTGTVAPRLQDSQRSESKHQPNEVDIFGNPQVSRAHCHPHSTVCAPVYGIFSQAILGVDFEKDLPHGPELIRTLQQTSCGKTGASKVETGLRFSPYNLVNLQTNHARFYDNAPILMLVPIEHDENFVKNWKPEQSYWVACFVGTWGSSTAVETNNYWWSQITSNIETAANKRKKCTPKDIGNAVNLLTRYTKAHADILAGRGGGVDPMTGKGARNYTPIDLFDGDSDRRAALLEVQKELVSTGTVRVPTYEAGKKAVLMKVNLTKVSTGGCIPDPALLASKAAINWSFRRGQKLLPACRKSGEIDEDLEELYEIARERDLGAASCPPQIVDVAKPSSSRRVTLSPEKEASGMAWETLDDD
jgi:hypothetical protein